MGERAKPTVDHPAADCSSICGTSACLRTPQRWAQSDFGDRGALVLAASAPAMLLAADHTPLLAALAWGILTMRIIPAILYVRARLRLIHGKPIRSQNTIILHLAVMGISLLLWMSGLADAAIMLATGVLLVRAIYGLYFSPPVAAKVIGFQEVFFGLTYTVVCAFAL